MNLIESVSRAQKQQMVNAEQQNRDAIAQNTDKAANPSVATTMTTVRRAAMAYGINDTGDIAG